MPLSNSNPILIRKYGDSMTECHLSVMSQQTTTATNRARVMHAIIHAWYMSGLISHSVYISITDSGPRGAIYLSFTVIPLESQNTVAITLLVDGWVRNFLDGGEPGRFHCMDSFLVP